MHFPHRKSKSASRPQISADWGRKSPGPIRVAQVVTALVSSVAGTKYQTKAKYEERAYFGPQFDGTVHPGVEALWGVWRVMQLITVSLWSGSRGRCMLVPSLWWIFLPSLLPFLPSLPPFLLSPPPSPPSFSSSSLSSSFLILLPPLPLLPPFPVSGPILWNDVTSSVNLLG